MDDKQTLRNAGRRARAGLAPDVRAAAEAAIARHLLALPEVATARTVLGYAARGAEASVDPVLAHLLSRGTTVLLPRVAGDHLEVAAVSDLHDLRAGFREVREPTGPALEVEADAEADVALVPGVAFDRAGGRLGQGGGYYDRLLAVLPEGTTTIGVCFVVQVVERVPRAAHDLAVDVVVTEGGARRAGRR